MASSSQTQNAQKEEEMVPVVPKHVFDLSDIAWRANNFLGLFDLLEGKEILYEARDFLLNCPLSIAFTTYVGSKIDCIRDHTSKRFEEVKDGAKSQCGKARWSSKLKVLKSLY